MNIQSSTLVSVVVTTHNQCRYLAEAIDSAFAQTINDVEVIVVDSGSTDATRGVLHCYEGRVRVVFLDNVGPSASRNEGAKLASGRFVTFLDGDDRLLPDCCQHRITLLNQNPEAALVVGATRIVDEVGTFVRHSGLEYERATVLTYQDLLRTMYGPPQGLTVRREAFHEVGGFDQDLFIAEDSDFVIRAAPLGVLYDPIPLADYRHAGSSLSRRPLLWYDSYRAMIGKQRLSTRDTDAFDQIVCPKFRDMCCDLLFARPLKELRLSGIPVVLGILAKRPALIPFLGYWMARMVRNRLRRTAQTPT